MIPAHALALRVTQTPQSSRDSVFSSTSPVGCFHLPPLQFFGLAYFRTARPATDGRSVDGLFGDFVVPLLLLGGPDSFRSTVPTPEHKIFIKQRWPVRIIRSLLRRISGNRSTRNRKLFLLLCPLSLSSFSRHCTKPLPERMPNL